MGFVTREQLGFDLSELIEVTIEQWSTISGAEIVPPSEDCGDFIASEMDARKLRQDDGSSDGALFNADVPPEQFRDAVIAALDRWLIETEISPLTAEEGEGYNRPCGE